MIPIGVLDMQYQGTTLHGWPNLQAVHVACEDFRNYVIMDNRYTIAGRHNGEIIAGRHNVH